MRVLHVMESTIGGTRRHLVDVARGQNARGHRVHLAVATTRDPGFPADLDELESEGVHVTRLPMVREIAPGRDWRDLRRLMDLLHEVRPDIVHTHSSKAGVLGRLASLRTGIGARVHTPHTFAFLFEALFGRFKRAVFRTIEARLARRSDVVVAVSESEARTFVESGVVPAERIRVVPNGIDPARFSSAAPADLSSLQLEGDGPLAAVIGLLYAAKGQDIALECLAKEGCEDLRLLIVGPGDDGELRELAERLGVAERVRFLGPRDDVPRLLAALDFTILPSRWEGMPYIVLEAMAAGLPVVATPVDGAREVIVHGETGLLAGEISSGALHPLVRDLCQFSEAERRSLGAAGRARVTAGYSVDHMVESLLAIYDELAG